MCVCLADIMLSGNLPFYAEEYDEFIEMLESTPVRLTLRDLNPT